MVKNNFFLIEYVLEHIVIYNKNVIINLSQMTMNNAFCFSAFSLLLFISESTPTPFKKCEGQSPPTNLRIKGCEDFPCKLYRGKNVTAEWDFIISK